MLNIYSKFYIINVEQWEEFGEVVNTMRADNYEDDEESIYNIVEDVDFSIFKGDGEYDSDSIVIGVIAPYKFDSYFENFNEFTDATEEMQSKLHAVFRASCVKKAVNPLNFDIMATYLFAKHPNNDKVADINGVTAKLFDACSKEINMYKQLCDDFGTSVPIEFC